MLSVPAINSSVAANTTRPAPRIAYLPELIQLFVRDSHSIKTRLGARVITRIA
jgi:hypothetical protein